MAYAVILDQGARRFRDGRLFAQFTNTSDAEIELGKVRITLSSGGTTLYTSYTNVVNLAPGATAGYATLVAAKGLPADATISAQIDYQTETVPLDPADGTLDTAGLSIAPTFSPDLLRITGPIVSTYPVRVDSPLLVTLFFDPSGRLVGGTRSLLDPIPANATVKVDTYESVGAYDPAWTTRFFVSFDPYRMGK